MASMVVKTRNYTHKNPSVARRGTISRTRAKVNGQKLNLRQLAARKTLKPRNERLYTNRNRMGNQRVYSQREESEDYVSPISGRNPFRTVK